MKTSVVAVRRGLLGVLTATAVGGALTVTLSSAATAAKDPCVASEVARTVGKVVTSTGDYLDGHPETNQVLTTALQQQPGPQTVAGLKSYFDANPKVQDDLTRLTAPLGEITAQCKLAVSLPQVLGLLQQAQNQGGLPGGLPPGLPAQLPPGLPVGLPGQVPAEPVVVR